MDSKTISLDFWGTLVQANPAFKQVKIDLVHKHFHAGFALDEIAQTQRAVKLHYDRLVEAWGMQPTQATLFADWLCRLGLEPEAYSFSLLSQFMEAYQAAARLLPAIPYTETTTDDLRILAREFKLVLISNTLFISGATIRTWLDMLDWSKYFDQLIFSDEAGIAKPSPQIFNLALSSINTHIGDNPRTDGIGAKQAGISFIGVHGPYHHNITDVYDRLKSS